MDRENVVAYTDEEGEEVELRVSSREAAIRNAASRARKSGMRADVFVHGGRAPGRGHWSIMPDGHVTSI